LLSITAQVIGPRRSCGTLSRRGTCARFEMTYGHMSRRSVSISHLLRIAADSTALTPFHQRMVVRHRRSVDPRGTRLEPKVAQRPRAASAVVPCNHDLEAPVMDAAPDVGAVEVLHYQLRTFEQFERKVIRNGVGHECNHDRAPAIGCDQLELLAMHRRGELRAYYDAEALDNERIEQGLALGELVIDRRLQAFLSPLRSEPRSRPRPRSCFAACGTWRVGVPRRRSCIGRSRWCGAVGSCATALRRAASTTGDDRLRNDSPGIDCARVDHCSASRAAGGFPRCCASPRGWSSPFCSRSRSWPRGQQRLGHARAPVRFPSALGDRARRDSGGHRDSRGDLCSPSPDAVARPAPAGATPVRSARRRVGSSPRLAPRGPAPPRTH
jgi:hypothetical protein